MASIFQLFGQIFIDNAEADKSIDTTTQKAEKSGSKISSAFSSIAKGAAAVGTAIVGAATTLGAGAYAMATSTATQADTIDKMSERTAINREELQRWMHACDQSGVSSDKLETAVKKMSDVLDDAAVGGKTATAALSRLGFSLDDFDGLSTEEKFSKIVSALADMEEGTERNAIGADVLGKAYTEMLPLLNAGSAGIGALKQEADDLGIVMSEDSVKAGVVLGDTIANVKAAFGGFRNQIGNAIIPIVQKFADLCIKNLPKVQKLVEKIIPVLVNVFDALLPPLFELIEGIFPILTGLIETLLPPLTDVITAILPVVIQLLQTLLPMFQTVISTVLPVFVQLINSLMPFFTQMVNDILPVIIRLIEALLPPILRIIDTVLPVILNLTELLLPLITNIIEAVLPALIMLVETLTPLLEPILDILNLILKPVTELLNVILPPLISLVKNSLMNTLSLLGVALNNMATALTNNFQTAFESLKRIFDNIKNIFSNVIDFVKNVFTGNWKGAWENVKNIFAGIWDNMKTVVKAPINFIIEGINTLIRGINKISFDVPDWVPGIGGKTLGFHVPEVPKLKTGLDYVPYDDYPALLHRGEQVLTASEKRERDGEKEQKPSPRTEVKVEIHIDNFHNSGSDSIEELVELMMQMIEEKIRQKGAVFA